MTDHLEELQAARDGLRRAEAALARARRARNAAVVRARAGGMTVAAIMAAADISRQGVYMALNDAER